jgi:hypothetical protein
MQLGVPGLPDRAERLGSGDLYAVDLEAASVRLTLTVQLLRNNLSQAPAIFLSNLPAASIIARFASVGAFDLLEKIKQGELILLTRVGDLSQQFFRHGAEKLAEELGRSGARPGSLLVVDRADDIFSIHDPNLAALQASRYRAWFQENGVTAVMLFLLRPELTYLASYRAITDYFSGSARIHAWGHELFFSSDYWNGAAGLTMGESFKLTVDSAGTLRAAGPESAPAAESGRPAPAGLARLPERHHTRAASLEADMVLHNCAELVDGLGDPSLAEWEYHHAFISLAERAQRARAATVLLSYAPDMELHQIAEQVFLLRRMLVPGVRIVVKESGRALRYSGTALLLKLGANFVLGDGMSRTRLVMALESLRGHTWQNGGLKFEVAVASAEPVGTSGVVPLSAFHAGVEASLAHGETLGVPCQLVVVPGLNRQQIFALLGAIRLARATDLISATEGALLLFLFGCDEEERTAVLKRILACPEAEPAGCYGYSAAADIRAALNAQFPVADALFEHQLVLAIGADEAGCGSERLGDEVEQEISGDAASGLQTAITGADAAGFAKRAHGS